MPITKAEIKQLSALQDSSRLHTHTGWRSFNHDNALPNALVIDVEDEAALQAVMKKITQLNEGKTAANRISVRAAAGGTENDPDNISYSFSACATADVIVRLSGVVFSQIEYDDGDTHVLVGGNMQIGELDQLLYETNLSLPTSSLIPYVTVAGLSATAGHGTGGNQPAFAGLIRAMRFCLPNGDIVQIDKSHPDFETIRGSHLGLFGILLKVELECIPAKKLRRMMKVMSAAELIEEMKQGLFTKHPYVSAMYMPTYHSDELTNKNYDNVIVYSWEPVAKNTPDMNNNTDLSEFNQRLAIDFADGLHVTDLLRTFPNLTPYYMRYFASKIGVGGKDGVAVGTWYDMFHYQTAFPWDLTEFGPLFEVSDQPKDGIQTPEMVAAFEKLVKTLTEAAAKGEYPLVYAAYLRYLQGTNGGLSMSMHRDNHHVCSMDMTTAHHIPGFDKFVKTMSEYTFTELHAKPHWGKNIPANVDFKQMYGESYDKFIQVLDKWYKDHGMSFEQSPLLNETFSRIFTPHQNVPALASTPVAQQGITTLTITEATQMAQKLLTQIGSDQSVAATELCRELNNICQHRAESYMSQLVGTLFNCCKPQPSPDNSVVRKTL